MTLTFKIIAGLFVIAVLMLVAIVKMYKKIRQLGNEIRNSRNDIETIQEAYSENKKRKDSFDTGNGADDFDNSLNVLQELSKRKRKRT